MIDPDQFNHYREWLHVHIKYVGKRPYKYKFGYHGENRLIVTHVIFDEPEDATAFKLSFSTANTYDLPDIS